LRYAFFSGCVTPQKENTYELSMRKVAEAVGFELVDLKEANCCGFFVEPFDYFAALVLGARDIALIEETGLDAVTLCPACFSHLNRVKSTLVGNDVLKRKVNEALSRGNRKFSGTANIKHFVGLLIQDLGMEKLKETITKPLSNLKVAPHYGCHILRPSQEIKLDNPEDPKLLDALLEITGAKLVDYSEKKLCCGSAAMSVNEGISRKITQAKMESIKKSGADAIVTVCPACHIHFDLTTKGILPGKFDIPVLHYTQLLGLAQGLNPKDLGLFENRVNTEEILKMIGAV
jgi:heterodisulfide reductase subunit B2